MKIQISNSSYNGKSKFGNRFLFLLPFVNFNIYDRFLYVSIGWLIFHIEFCLYNIEKLNKKETEKEIILPKYANVGKTAMRLVLEDNQVTDLKTPYYYRDAGFWGVEIKIENNVILSKSNVDSLNNMSITEITKEEWENDNDGYI